MRLDSRLVPKFPLICSFKKCTRDVIRVTLSLIMCLFQEIISEIKRCGFPHFSNEKIPSNKNYDPGYFNVQAMLKMVSDVAGH